MKPDPQTILRTKRLVDSIAELPIKSHKGMLFIDYCILVSQLPHQREKQLLFNFGLEALAITPACLD